MGAFGSKVVRQTSLDGVQHQQTVALSLQYDKNTPERDMKWTQLGMVFFLLLSIVMTGCFLWQYQLPKVEPDAVMDGNEKSEHMCPRFPEPIPLEHPIPSLKEALEKVDMLLRHSIHSTSLPSLSAIVIFNDTVLWTGNFGKKNGSDPFSPPPNEYTIYRIASLSKIFPTLMLYRLWEEGKVGSLDDPLEKYMENFTIKNPLGKSRDSELKYITDGLIFLDSGEVQIRTSSVTLRRMASQLSGLPRRLRATNLLWKGKTQTAINLLQDDVLVADPGTRCHYSNLAFSLLAHVLADKVVGTDYQRWISDSILDRLGMEDTGFDITPAIQNQMAVGFYSNGQPAPLYDLGWYRTPWEVNEQLGYEVLRKDGDLDGYSATFSLVPRLKMGLVLLMAGSRPQEEDLVAKTYSYIIPAMETAFREARRILAPPPNPAPYVGFYTYSNITFYEIKTGSDGVLIMQQFGPHIEDLIPERYRTIKLNYLEDRVFQVIFEKEYPCVLRVSTASVSLEAQDGQLFNFYPFDKKGQSPGFDAPGLNTYNVVRILRRPTFTS
ncbi:BLML protein, partial [Atractosteus spatula]|nr:BLML protein [Atractosteus spatula]